jgi:hypothetical protein
VALLNAFSPEPTQGYLRRPPRSVPGSGRLLWRRRHEPVKIRRCEARHGRSCLPRILRGRGCVSNPSLPGSNPCYEAAVRRSRISSFSRGPKCFWSALGMSSSRLSRRIPTISPPSTLRRRRRHHTPIQVTINVKTMMGKPTTMNQNELVSPLPHCDSPSLLSHVAPDSTYIRVDRGAGHLRTDHGRGGTGGRTVAGLAGLSDGISEDSREIWVMHP